MNCQRNYFRRKKTNKTEKNLEYFYSTMVVKIVSSDEHYLRFLACRISWSDNHIVKEHSKQNVSL